MLIWILDILSKIKVHSAGLLVRCIVRSFNKNTEYVIHHVPDKAGHLYIEQKGGTLDGLVLFVDFKTNASLEDPLMKIIQYPFKCRNTYLFAIKNQSEPDMKSLVELMVYGVIPLVMESTREHVVKQIEDMLSI